MSKSGRSFRIPLGDARTGHGFKIINSGGNP
jgi:hypothetical protein